MTAQNMLSADMTLTELKAAYDASVKKLLANKIILAWIMKNTLEEYKDCSVEDIRKKYIERIPQVSSTRVMPDEEGSYQEKIRGGSNEDSTLYEGTVYYDIRFMAALPDSDTFTEMIINVEAQKKYYNRYPLPKRSIYYEARMMSSQYGTEFTHAHYEKIKKVNTIWICMNPPKKRRSSICRYSIQEENLVGNVQEDRKNYDLMTDVIIYLGDSGDERYSGIIRLLDVLFSNQFCPAEKKAILQKEFNIDMTDSMEREAEEMCNLSDLIEEQGIQKGIKQGKNEGLVYGLEKGRAEGRVEGILESALNLINATGWSVSEAVKTVGVPEEYRKQLEEELSKKLN